MVCGPTLLGLTYFGFNCSVSTKCVQRAILLTGNAIWWIAMDGSSLVKI